MSRRKKIVAAVIAASVLGIAAVGCAETPSEQSAEAAKPKAATTEKAAAPAAETTTEKKAEKKDKPAETAGQQNARESAESYLEFSAFSRKGLIEQLKYEGYSTKDATYAVDAVNANWNKQAAKAAKAYLDMSSFSRSGLIEQLEYEGYTTKQATYGVNQTGL